MDSFNSLKNEFFPARQATRVETTSWTVSANVHAVVRLGDGCKVSPQPSLACSMLDLGVFLLR